MMLRFLFATCLTLGTATAALAQTPYHEMARNHAAANNIPPEIVHRIIMRESRYNPNAMGKHGAIGLMQIKLGTARALGYTGTAEGLRDPETNLRYGVKYLAGAWRTANGHADRTVGYYASGYYYAAKRQRQAGGLSAQPRIQQASAGNGPLQLVPSFLMTEPRKSRRR